MIEYKGTIELVYYNRTIRIPYNMTNLGGSPHIYFSDKYGHHHSFAYLYNREWRYGCTKGPYWRADFMEVLFKAMDLEKERHGL